VSLVGYTARMQVRSTLESAEALIELTTANGRIALGGSAGTITLTISATDTRSLDRRARGLRPRASERQRHRDAPPARRLHHLPQRDEVTLWPLNWSSRRPRPPLSLR
jgi:hypothetical protein